ncbi:site-specific DNA-methyltransferase (adenine-specific)/adenine-specific DNA-methyltransferase [Burkholderia sp. WP9]|uniref:site-specific DNA-methyltransferase n=1 Tax=Burkholderia sp. WP9 TaxID=1500263 RepID=UPI000896CBB6|nr:site-specific DNA-methyltransferase [Burkholderia sp. WP9]SED35302.1 site-specific DNA-methyltransferase (adenine-specific)/adenine-specific DNA-methyltransferase [Burkholderia sp. WP9]
MPALQWIGKEAVTQHHKDIPFRLIEPVPEISAGQEDTGNLVIRGDNLEALKALLPRYSGQVKCVYIDPPYNTGNEAWMYNDNVNSPEIRRWLGEVVGKEGETLDRHDRWLCMMYPRLLLLKQFLASDGVIFVSIGDDELHHLRALMDEIFGVKRRLTTFVWRTDGNFDNQAKIKNCHEYILAYAMSPELFPFPKLVDPSVGGNSKLNRDKIQNTIVKNGPKNPVSDVTLPAGFPASIECANISARTDKWPRYEHDVLIENGALVRAVVASSGWSSKDILLQFIQNGFEAVKDSKGQQTRFVLTHTGAIESIKERQAASHVISVISGVGSTQSQSAELEELGFKFPFPKPVDLLKYLFSMIDTTEGIFLDSFAGSGTTGHAVLKKNAEDGGKRRFILVELSEKIAQTVTAPRLKAICEGYRTSKGVDVPGLGGGFQFCHLSDRALFATDGAIRSDVTFDELAEFVWFVETGTGVGMTSQRPGQARSPLLGVFDGRAVFLFYNGILKDRSDAGGNVLNARTLAIMDEILPHFGGARVVYGARSRFDKSKLSQLNLTFNQLPYELAVKSWA